MKKCPFCGAVLEDHARFCLYCMKELEKKAVIEKKKPLLTKQKIRLIVLCAAALLLAVVLLLLSRCSRGEQQAPDDTREDTTAAQTPPESDAETDASSEESSGETIGTAEGTAPPITAPSTDDVPSTGTSSTTTPSTGTMPNTAAVPSTVTAPSTETAPGDDTTADIAPGPDTTPSTVVTPAESDPPKTMMPIEQVTYTYRDAQFYDLIDAPDNADKGLLSQNAVVITGVETVAKSGVYVIPEEIDGKKVVAVKEGAFSAPGIRDTVKKVVFPASIHSVWEKFQFCSDLTDLYFAGDSVVVDTFSLIPNKSRVTVHGASDCICYGSSGKSTLKERSAQFGIGYQSWDGNGF